MAGPRPFATLSFVIAALIADSAQANPPITAVALSPDGAQIVLGSQGGIEVRSLPELALTARLTTELANVHDLVFSPDGKTLLAAGGAPAESGAVELWNWPAGRRLRYIADHKDVVYRVAWSPDGWLWATAGADSICRVYLAETGALKTHYKEHSRAVLSISFLDRETIASAGADQTIRIWEAATGQHRRTLDNHVAAVNAISVRPGPPAPAGIVVATISEDRTVRLWQPMLGRLMRFARLPSPPRAVDWSADGERLFVGCNDGQIRVVDAESMEIVEDIVGLEGRIHELVTDRRRSTIVVCGEGGCRCGIVPAPCRDAR
ncbi:MAG TPA: WD40 repeat domain-containing protein [Caulifigura sp.]|nr:WD40 repeat domain-containing protein [Caulifigura sp.]